MEWELFVVFLYIFQMVRIASWGGDLKKQTFVLQVMKKTVQDVVVSYDEDHQTKMMKCTATDIEENHPDYTVRTEVYNYECRKPEYPWNWNENSMSSNIYK